MSHFNEPLSIKFIHKPSRTQQLFEKNIGELNTRRNSDTNKLQHFVVHDENAGHINAKQHDVSHQDAHNHPSKRLDPLHLGGKDVFPNGSVENLSVGKVLDLNKGNYKVTGVEDSDVSSDSFSPLKATSRGTSIDSSTNEVHEDFPYKLVRKKSGEVVRPNLKKSMSATYFDRNVSMSLPTTPNYKQVHFGGASDVKYFKKRDKPNAISASNSPTVMSPELSVGLSDDDSELELDSSFDSEEEFSIKDLHSQGTTAYPNPKHRDLIEWKLDLLNFPTLNYDANFSASKTVFLERVFISIDKKYMLGHIAVKNVSFQKDVVLRYTFDDWLTIIEIPTIYVPDIPAILRDNGYDRFVFKIQLNKMFNSYGSNSNSEGNQFQFCIKYVSGNHHEHWDNNQFKNYKFNLIKKIKTSSESGIQLSSGSFTSPVSTHFKPRYSTSYLRRRSSDSNLTNLDSDIDYVNNNFYLSSPLLSNFNNNSYSSELFNLNTNTSNDTLIPNKNFTNLDDNKSFDLKSLNSNLYKNLLNSQSYKEFLDNYCFYSKGDEENKPESSKKKNDEASSPSYTVSSFLGT